MAQSVNQTIRQSVNPSMTSFPEGDGNRDVGGVGLAGGVGVAAVVGRRLRGRGDDRDAGYADRADLDALSLGARRHGRAAGEGDESSTDRPEEDGFHRRPKLSAELGPVDCEFHCHFPFVVRLKPPGPSGVTRKLAALPSRLRD